MSNLTESQKRAIETDARDVLVIAGAGSGKTTVLTRRINHLLTQCGASASELLVLTFTRKAAAEMKSRLRALLTESQGAAADRVMSGIMAGTFHSIGLSILRADGHHIGYHAGLTVCDEDDAELLIESCARDLGYLGDKGWKKDLSMKKVKAYLEQWYTLIDRKMEGQSLQLSTLIKEYQSRLFQMNCLDFGSILSEVVRLFTTHDEVLARWRSRIKHVLVDELQDANAIQHYGFLDMFCPPATFFGVGDRRQAIYGFRGSRPDLMTERHPEAEIIDLRECFRCGNAIVESANNLITHNGDTLAQPMIGATGRRGRVDVFSGRSSSIAEDCQNTYRQIGGYAWSDIAVMARNHRTLRRLEDVFREQNIPCHRVGAAFDICGTWDFKLILSCMRLAANNRYNLAFLHCYQACGVSHEHYAHIRSLAAKQGLSHFQAMIGWCEGDYESGVAEVIAYGGEMAKLGKDDILIENTLATLFVDRLVTAMWPDGTQGHGIREFWEAQCKGMSLEEALTWYALRDQADDMREGDHVTLLTVHAAKGLEWPAVIIANCNEGDFPSSQSLKEEEGLKEERRVAYVAITRAKEFVGLHYRKAEDQAEGRKIKTPSRFLLEAGMQI